MTNIQTKVKEWMKKFGQTTPETPVLLDETTAVLRAKLIWEEALETIVNGLGVEPRFVFNNVFKEGEVGGYTFHKVAEVNLVELADGIADLAVVSQGTAVAAGIDMEEVEEEVMRSNFSKLFSEDDVHFLWETWQKENGDSYDERSLADGFDVDYKVVKAGDKFLVKNSSGKVMKPRNYSAATPFIEAILEKQSK